VVLYLPQWLESFLRQGDVSLAHELAWASQTLPYFAHSLEMLLRATIEGTKRDDTFPNRVVRLLDSFPESLDVAAAYTRKTEVENWGRLFELIGDPRELFDVSIVRAAGPVARCSRCRFLAVPTRTQKTSNCIPLPDRNQASERFRRIRNSRGGSNGIDMTDTTC
jgi:hypothetical protein